MSDRLGLIGVGHLAGYLVAGWRRANPVTPAISLSPRNAARAAALAAAYGAQVASSNQAVVDASDVVVLATRPGDAAAVLAGLRFRPDQTLVSVAAGLPLAVLAPAAAPAATVRSLPLSCAAIGESPTLLYPENTVARALFAPLGPVYVLDQEEQFAAASAISAFYTWLFALFAEATAWAEGAGLPPALGRELVLRTAHGAAGMALDRPAEGLGTMVASLSTPGGLSELGLSILRNGDGLPAWVAGLDAVLARLQVRKPVA